MVISTSAAQRKSFYLSNLFLGLLLPFLLSFRVYCSFFCTGDAATSPSLGKARVRVERGAWGATPFLGQMGNRILTIALQRQGLAGLISSLWVSYDVLTSRDAQESF